jgi:hypothetical protein
VDGRKTDYEDGSLMELSQEYVQWWALVLTMLQLHGLLLVTECHLQSYIFSASCTLRLEVCEWIK